MTALVRGNDGKRGRWQAAATATAVALLAFLAVVAAGCGGSGQSSTGSPLDQKAAGATVAARTGTGTTARVATVGGNQQVLAGYTENQCVADMTARYGSAAAAQKVCAELSASYGPATPESQMATILPKVESKVGVTPVPGAKIPGQPAGSSQPGQPAPGGGGGTPPSGGTPPGGGSPAPSQPTSGGGGWPSGGISITVPGSP